jgi:hypothetical protein
MDPRPEAQDAKTVGESLGNEKLSSVVCGKTDAEPTPEEGRIGPDVHSHIENLSGENGNQLGLGPGFLKMKAAEGVPDRIGKIVLDEVDVDAQLPVPPSVVGFQKISAPVPVDVGSDDQNAV